jgi:vesicle transport through interaction with t-SNAREs protein 1
MTSIPFERYDDEFKELTDQVTESLESQKLEHTQNLLSQCDDLLKQMSVEARGVDDSLIKRQLLDKVRTCKALLTSLKDRFQQVRNDQERQGLLQTGGGGGSKALNAHRERLLQNETSIENQNETLENARRVMAETEDVALEITHELGRNRETIESAHGRVRQVHGLTGRARRLLQNMNRRAVQQKMALYAVGVAICLVFLIFLWKFT